MRLGNSLTELCVIVDKLCVWSGLEMHAVFTEDGHSVYCVYDRTFVVV